MTALPESIDEVSARLQDRRYIGDRQLATAVFLALKLGKPLFLEGEAGVGKTEAAKVMAEVLGARLIRLQCYEGIDVAHAVYEWNYPRQLLHIRMLQDAPAEDRRLAERAIYGPEFLLRRPLLDAIDNDDAVPPVLLIDEIDRSDEEFEAFLLELLSDFQISIPEIGTIGAKAPPFVVLTSNRTREVHDALKRRCLYHWIDYPTSRRRSRSCALARLRPSEELAREVDAAGPRACARWSSTRFPGSPRRWTGHVRWPRSGLSGWTRRWSTRRWARRSSIRRTWRRSAPRRRSWLSGRQPHSEPARLTAGTRGSRGTTNGPAAGTRVGARFDSGRT